MLKGNPPPQQWARFVCYANYVQRCKSHPDPDDNGTWIWRVDTMVFSYLFMYNDHKPLLPRLKRLKWYQDSLTESNWGLSCLLTPSLCHLTILSPSQASWDRHSPTPFRVNMMLESVAHMCPALRHLSLQGTFKSHIKCLPAPLVQSKKLRYLDVRRVGKLERRPLLLRQLAKLPALLTLHVASDEKWSRIPQPSVPPALPLNAGSDPKPRNIFRKLKKVFINGTQVNVEAFVVSKVVVEALQAESARAAAKG